MLNLSICVISCTKSTNLNRNIEWQEREINWATTLMTKRFAFFPMGKKHDAQWQEQTRMYQSTRSIMFVLHSRPLDL